jgi:hypothetical protein
VFVDLPPTGELLRPLSDTTVAGLAFLPGPDSAAYALVGRIGQGGAVSYAWLRVDANAATQRRSPFPPRSNWVALPDTSAGEQLDAYGYALGRVNYWLTVTPQDTMPFPYHLALKRADVKPAVYKTLGDTTPNHGGEAYDLVLRKDPTLASKEFDRQWVYVFIIDRDGQGQLLFGQSQNHMPPDSLGQLDQRDEIPLPRRDGPITICPSYGVDTFILVASAKPVPVPAAVFNFPPIRDAQRTRSAGTRPPDNWSIERISIRSEPPPADAQTLISRGMSECQVSRDTLLSSGAP